jgi:peptidyl-prolyl cis-trans isomerase D
MAMGGFRSFAKSKWALVIFGLLLAVFGFNVGQSDVFRGVDFVGGGFISAGERKVAGRDVTQELNFQLERLRRENGQVITQEQAVAQGAIPQLVDQLQQQALKLAYADKFGIVASPKAVTDLIAAEPAFKDSFGKVDMRIVAQEASGRGMDVKQYENYLRDRITLNSVDIGLQAGLRTPALLTKPIASFYGERRDLAIAALTPASVASPKEPTEDQLKAFFEAHSANFAEPERRSISILTYSPDDFLDKAEVTDALIKGEYDRRIKEFSGPEVREIEQFISDDRNAVQTIVDTAAQGTTLEDLSKKTPGVIFSKLSVKPTDVTNKQYSENIFALPKDKVFGPVQVGDIWYGVKVVSITPGAATPLAEVSGRLKAELAHKAAKQLFNASGETFTGMIGGGGTLEEVSAEIGAPVIMVSDVDSRGAHAKLGRSSLLSPHAEALQHMFSAKVGEISDIIEGENQRTVLRLDGIKPTHTPPLDQVRARVHDAYMADEMEKAKEAAATALVTAVKAGTPIDKAATAAKMQFGRFPHVARTDQQIDPGLLGEAFTLAEGEVKMVKDQRGMPWVVKVEKLDPYDPKADPQLADQVEQRLRSDLAQDVADLFFRELQKEVKLHRNEAAIEAYAKSFAKKEEGTQ